MKNKEKEFKNTPMNRFFHKKEVKANQEKVKALKKVINLGPQYLQEIGDITVTEGDFDSAKVTGATSLLEVLDIHKKAWVDGFQNENIGPDKYGIYRCESIETMTPSQVYLGNIFGLWTKDIPFWEKYKNEGKSGGGFEIYQYLTVYQIILRQYKRQLSSNIRAIAKNAELEVTRLTALGY